MFGPYAAAADPTHKRLTKADQLAASPTQFANATTQAGMAQTAWTRSRLILANAFSFDVRVQPLNVAQAYAGRLPTVAHSLCGAIVDPCGPVEEYHAGLGVPTHRVGVVIPNPSQSAPLARLASVLEAGPALRAAIAEWVVSNAADADEATSPDLPDVVARTSNPE
jgi:hypothetical protein